MYKRQTEDPNVFYYGAQYGPHSVPYQGTGIYRRFSGNTWSESLQPGGFGFITIIHELGHAMGLAHPHDDGGGSQQFPGVFNTLEKGDNDLNQIIFTLFQREIFPGLTGLHVSMIPLVKM